MEEEWGRDSNTFRIRVLGEFPTSEAEWLLSRSI